MTAFKWCYVQQIFNAICIIVWGLKAMKTDASNPCLLTHKYLPWNKINEQILLR